MENLRFLFSYILLFWSASTVLTHKNRTIMKPIGMKKMDLIFSITDEIDISREAIEVPLLLKGEGSVRILPNRKIENVIQEEIELVDWLPIMQNLLIELSGK